MQQFGVYLAAVLVTVILSLGNIGLKAVSGTLGAVLGGLRELNFNPVMASLPLYVGVGCCYALGAGLWMWVLNHLPLNRAFLFVALTFIFVPLFSHFLLGERIGTGVLVGTPIIVLGIIVATAI